MEGRGTLSFVFLFVVGVATGRDLERELCNLLSYLHIGDLEATAAPDRVLTAVCCAIEGLGPGALSVRSKRLFLITVFHAFTVI